MSKADFPSVDLNEILALGQLPAMPQNASRRLEVSKDDSGGPTDYG